MKWALALIVALQVSMVCMASDPPQELVDKYKDLKDIFYKRLVNVYEKAHAIVVPLAEGTITGEKAKEILGDVKENPHFQNAAKLATAVGEELEPAIEKARLAALGAYSEHLRPYIGAYIDHAINIIKPVLDTWLPNLVVSMHKLLTITVLIAFLAMGAESFRLTRQAEEEEKGTVATMMDTLRSYYDQSLNKASGYYESIKGLKLDERAKNLYDETTSAVRTYAGIFQDQLYHIIYPEDKS